jgi:hypothetical protein
MDIELFGQFLVRVPNGKIKGQNIRDALMKQKSFSQGYKKLGEILVDDGLLTPEELEDYLEQYHSEKEGQGKK